MQTNGTINCRLCQAPIPVTFVRAPNTPRGHVVLALVDTAPLSAHMEQCQPAVVGAGGALERPAAPVPVAPALVLPGTRPCVMCGTANAACLDAARGSGPTGGHPVGPACCGACRDGNTHPAPGESLACSSWAASR